MSDVETSHYRICPLCEACCGLEIRTAPGLGGARGGDAFVPGARAFLGGVGGACPPDVGARRLGEGRGMSAADCPTKHPALARHKAP